MDRSGTLTIGGQTFTVSQPAPVGPGGADAIGRGRRTADSLLIF